MTTPIHAQLAAIHTYTDGVLRSNDDYARYAFAATKVRMCAGTCGGYICTANHSDYCDPCRDAARQR